MDESRASTTARDVTFCNLHAADSSIVDSVGQTSAAWKKTSLVYRSNVETCLDIRPSLCPIYTLITRALLKSSPTKLHSISTCTNFNYAYPTHSDAPRCRYDGDCQREYRHQRGWRHCCLVGRERSMLLLEDCFEGSGCMQQAFHDSRCLVLRRSLLSNLSTLTKLYKN
jgi:hypothetical protein